MVENHVENRALERMENLRNAKVPRGAPVGRLLQVLVVGGAGVYGIANSLFNVEGGHRAIVFNRISGIKEQVRSRLIICRQLGISQIIAVVQSTCLPVGARLLISMAMLIGRQEFYSGTTLPELWPLHKFFRGGGYDTEILHGKAEIQMASRGSCGGKGLWGRHESYGTWFERSNFYRIVRQGLTLHRCMRKAHTS